MAAAPNPGRVTTGTPLQAGPPYAGASGGATAGDTAVPRPQDGYGPGGPPRLPPRAPRPIPAPPVASAPPTNILEKLEVTLKAGRLEITLPHGRLSPPEVRDVVKTMGLYLPEGQRWNHVILSVPPEVRDAILGEDWLTRHMTELTVNGALPNLLHVCPKLVRIRAKRASTSVHRDAVAHLCRQAPNLACLDLCERPRVNPGRKAPRQLVDALMPLTTLPSFKGRAGMVLLGGTAADTGDGVLELMRPGGLRSNARVNGASDTGDELVAPLERALGHATARGAEGSLGGADYAARCGVADSSLAPLRAVAAAASSGRVRRQFATLAVRRLGQVWSCREGVDRAELGDFGTNMAAVLGGAVSRVLAPGRDARLRRRFREATGLTDAHRFTDAQARAARMREIGSPAEQDEADQAEVAAVAAGGVSSRPAGGATHEVDVMHMAYGRDTILVYTNRGAGSTPDAEVQVWAVPNFRSEHLRRLRDDRTRPFGELKDRFNDAVGHGRRALPYASLPLDAQRIGNCSWASRTGALFGWMCVEGGKMRNARDPRRRLGDCIKDAAREVRPVWEMILWDVQSELLDEVLDAVIEGPEWFDAKPTLALLTAIKDRLGGVPTTVAHPDAVSRRIARIHAACRALGSHAPQTPPAARPGDRPATRWAD